MNNFIDLNDFYNEYYENSEYKKANKNLNIMSMVCIVIIFISSFIIYLLIYFLKIHLILVIIISLSLIALFYVVFSSFILSQLHDEKFFKIISNYKYYKKKRQKILRSIDINRIKSFDNVLERFGIKEKGDLYFIYQYFQRKYDSEVKKKKSFTEILSWISIIVSMLSLMLNRNLSGQVEMMVYIGLFLAYYGFVCMISTVQQLSNKYKLDIYEFLLEDIELKIMNYNKKLT